MKNLFLLIGLFFTTISLIAQGNLQFNRVKIVTNVQETVPAGKVWKATSIYGTVKNCIVIGPCYTALSPNSYGFVYQTGLFVNGTLISSRNMWERGDFYSNNSCTNDPRPFTTTANNCSCDQRAIDLQSDPNLLPIWLPSGTTVSSLGINSFVSIVEFNVVP